MNHKRNRRNAQLRTVIATVVTMLAAFALPGGSLLAAEPVFSDSALFNRASTAYDDDEWLDAARYLTAYIHRQTNAYESNAFFAGQVEAALQFSLDRIEDEQQSLRFDANHWRNQAYGAVQQCTAQCPSAEVFVSSVAGLMLLPEKPALVAPPDSGPTAASTSFRVVDVEAGDSLNVRAGAGVQNRIVGRIADDSRGVSVTGGGVQVGTSLWLPVQYGGFDGWVNSYYLGWDSGDLPGQVRHARDLSERSQRLHGLDVRLVQRRLTASGYGEVGPIDGWYGPVTAGAVRRFQQLNGLAVTGVVDAATWQRLFDAGAVGGG